MKKIWNFLTYPIQFFKQQKSFNTETIRSFERAEFYINFINDRLKLVEHDLDELKEQSKYTARIH